MMRPPCLLRAHLHRRRARAGERPAEVRLHDRVEVLVGHLPQHPVAQHARVGDHDVEAPELGHRAPDQRVGRGGVADRADLGDGAAAGGGDGLDSLLRRVRVDVVDDHARARARERERVGAAEPAAAPGDHGDLAVQRERAHA